MGVLISEKGVSGPNGSAAKKKHFFASQVSSFKFQVFGFHGMTLSGEGEGERQND